MNTSPEGRTGWRIAPQPVGHPDSAILLYLYFDELASRYYGREMTDAEVEEVLEEEPSDDLTLPTGEFFVAQKDGSPVGCVGLRVLDPATVELTRMYIRPDIRGEGGAARLLAAAEETARNVLRAEVIRLDTRGDLVEARALYAKHGYTEIPDYNASPYADHWFEKKLT